jgi:hypothetical protein
MVELELSTVFADRVMGKDSDRANPNHSNLVDLGAQLVERNQKEIQQMFSRVRLMYRPYSEFRNVKYQV